MVQVDIGVNTRLGQANITGDVRSLFLKKFSGEVLTTFHTESVMRPLHRVRQITNGKSSQFPVIGVASTKVHTPGQSILQSTLTDAMLSQIPHAEVVIQVDGKRLSSVFVPDWDDMVNHYEVWSTYARELGTTLAETYDKKLIMAAALGVNATETLTAAGQLDRSGGTTGGLAIDGSSASVQASHYIDGFYSAAQNFDEKGVPKAGRYALVTPEVFYLLIKEKSSFLIDKDLTNSNGDTAKAQLKMVAGMDIVVSARATDVFGSNTTSTDPDHALEYNTYESDTTNLRALCFQREGLGSVMLRDIQTQAEYSLEYQGDVMVASHVWGAKVLRPECFYGIEDDGTP